MARLPSNITNNLRVLMLGPLPPPVGGMATVVENLEGALEGRVDLKVLNNVKTTPPDRSLWQGIAAQLGLIGRLALYSGSWRPAIVHIHTCSWFTFWRNGVDVLVARLLGRRVVLHIHGAEFRRFLSGLSPSLRWLARRILNLASRVVVLGDGWKQLLDTWTDPARVVVVPNGVPVPEPVALSAEGGFRIVCLANYERRKGQRDLLQAVTRLNGERPIYVDLFGFEAEAGQQDTLLALARELGIAERVRVPGPIGGAAKDAALRQANCFCLPSYDEGLPMSMLEAMASGLPIIVTRVGAIPEAVVDGRDGLLFSPGDVDQLTAHIKTLRDDPSRAEAIAHAGRARVSREFSLDHVAELILDLYGDLS